MKYIILSLALIATIAPATAKQPAKQPIRQVTCMGEGIAAHTLTIGDCSFSGDVGIKVAHCMDTFCVVKAEGYDNGHGITIITKVKAVTNGNEMGL